MKELNVNQIQQVNGGFNGTAAAYAGSWGLLGALLATNIDSVKINDYPRVGQFFPVVKAIAGAFVGGTLGAAVHDIHRSYQVSDEAALIVAEVKKA